MLGLIITRGDEIGGAQTHLLSIVTSLKDEGLDFIVFVGSSGIFSQNLESKGIKVIYLKYLMRDISIKNDFKAIYELYKLIKKYKVNTLNAHSSKAGLISRIAGKLSGIKVVFTVHGWAFADGISETKRFLYSRIERSLAIFTYKFINVSNADYLLAQKYKIGQKSQHSVIHNGIQDIKKNIHIKRHDYTVVRFIMIARFCEQKDHLTIINALGRIKNLNWEMNFVGSGDYNPYLKIADNLGISNKINFLGERNDISDLLEKSDVFLLCSNWEGFPISIIEAMRASKYILASNVGGVNESVALEYLLQRGDVDSWVEKLIYILNNPEVMHFVGKENREKYLNEFNSDVMYSKYKKIIFNNEC